MTLRTKIMELPDVAFFSSIFLCCIELSENDVLVVQIAFIWEKCFAVDILSIENISRREFFGASAPAVFNVVSPRGTENGTEASIHTFVQSWNGWELWTFSTTIGCIGLHKLWYPSIRDTSTWSKFGARHREHGDVFLFSNLGALWFSEN